MNGDKGSVLIVDDEADVREVLDRRLRQDGYSCATAETGAGALCFLASGPVDVVLLDMWLPDISGMGILSRVIASEHPASVIVITRDDSIDRAVAAIRGGASDYIIKPFRLDVISERVRAVMEARFPARLRRPDAPRRTQEAAFALSEAEMWKELDAIADGVEVRHDVILDHSKIILQEAAEIGRSLDLPEDVIQRWIQARLGNESVKAGRAWRSLFKLEKNMRALELMGLMVPYVAAPGDDRVEN